MSDQQMPASQDTVAGERVASPVAGSNLDGKRALRRRAIAVLALLAFGGLFIWGWGKPKGGVKDQSAKLVVSQRASFEPAREAPQPPGPPIQRAAFVVPAARPPSPPPQRTEADQLMDAARRAPVLIFNRSVQARPATGTNENAGDVTASLPYGGPVPPGRSEPRNELADQLKPTQLEGVRAARLPNRNLVVAQGTSIPCVLETAMSSDVSGFVSCVVERDVMSDNGHVVLLEKGTQVVGEYRGNVRRGSSRMFVLWNRAKSPTGVIVSLASPATDALGRAGFDGQIDSHFWDRFGGALLLSIVGDAGQIAGQQISGTGVQINSAQSGSQSAAAIATEQSINIPPTLVKNQGELVAIFVARDLDFSSVYSLRLVGTRSELLDRSIGGAPTPYRPVYKP